MTQEEFYLWLLNYETSLFEYCLPDFNSEFLKNYEIAKLFLEKFEIEDLDKEYQKKLNLGAISNWFRSSEYITLQYDIPEIIELIPEKIRGFLDLRNSEIKSLSGLRSVGSSLYFKKSQTISLPDLESVGGNLNLRESQVQLLPKLKIVEESLDAEGSKIESLPELETIGYDLSLKHSKIEYLPELEYVGMDLYLLNSKIQSLPKLKYVGNIYIEEDQHNYWINYFRKTGKSNLVERINCVT